MDEGTEERAIPEGNCVGRAASLSASDVEIRAFVTDERTRLQSRFSPEQNRHGSPPPWRALRNSGQLHECRERTYRLTKTVATSLFPQRTKMKASFETRET